MVRYGKYMEHATKICTTYSIFSTTLYHSYFIWSQPVWGVPRTDACSSMGYVCDFLGLQGLENCRNADISTSDSVSRTEMHCQHFYTSILLPCIYVYRLPYYYAIFWDYLISIHDIVWYSIILYPSWIDWLITITAPTLQPFWLTAVSTLRCWDHLCVCSAKQLLCVGWPTLQTVLLLGVISRHSRNYS